MVWNDTAFDHLVYDEQQKDLVLAFVENHNNAKPMMGDVIVGKGEGLIILLSGPPGTGKTLTAEAGKCLSHNSFGGSPNTTLINAQNTQWPTVHIAHYSTFKLKISVLALVC